MILHFSYLFFFLTRPHVAKFLFFHLFEFISVQLENISFFKFPTLFYIEKSLSQHLRIFQSMETHHLLAFKISAGNFERPIYECNFWYLHILVLKCSHFLIQYRLYPPLHRIHQFTWSAELFLPDADFAWRVDLLTLLHTIWL